MPRMFMPSRPSTRACGRRSSRAGIFSVEDAATARANTRPREPWIMSVLKPRGNRGGRAKADAGADENSTRGPSHESRAAFIEVRSLPISLPKNFTDSERYKDDAYNTWQARNRYNSKHDSVAHGARLDGDGADAQKVLPPSPQQEKGS